MCCGENVCHLLGITIVYYNTLEMDLFLEWDLHKTAQKVTMYCMVSFHQRRILLPEPVRKEMKKTIKDQISKY